MNCRIRLIFTAALLLPLVALAGDTSPTYPRSMISPFDNGPSAGPSEHLSVVDDSTSIFQPDGLQIRLVPEPGSVALLGVGAAVIFWRRRGA
jgi:hypothetical protein